MTLLGVRQTFLQYGRGEDGAGDDAWPRVSGPIVLSVS